jgi:arabinofuranan 3-O-arabinosyltransferase
MSFSKETSFANLFRLFGHWALEKGHQGDPYYPFIAFYQNGFVVVVGYLLTALAFMGLLRKKNKYLLFFAILLLVSLFVTKGRHRPLAFINNFMYMRVPFFWIIRNQWQKMMPLIIMSLAILMGSGASLLYKKIVVKSKVCGNIFIAVVLALIIIQGWPLITSRHFAYQSGRKYLKDFYVDIPDYWFQASEWIESQVDDERIVLLPPSRFAPTAFEYRWGYVGISLSNLLIQRPLIAADKKLSGSLQQNVSSKITNPLFYYFLRNGRYIPELYYRILDIKYVLQRNDFDREFRANTFRIEVPGYISNVFNSDYAMELKNQFGNLAIYGKH